MRAALEREGVEILRGRFLDFRDPWGNRVQIVDYRDHPVHEAARACYGRWAWSSWKSGPRALSELRERGFDGS